MPQNLTLYLQSDAPITPEVIAEIVTDATVTSVGPVHVVWDDLTVILNLMTQQAVAQHLQGFVGFAKAVASDTNLDMLREVKQVVGMVIEPGIDSKGRIRDLTLGLAQAFEGFFFVSIPDIGFGAYDPLNRLMFASGSMNEAFFYTPPPQTGEGLDRRRRSILQLQEANIKYIEHLPAIEPATDVQLPDKSVILDRALALLLLANIAGTLPFDRFDELVVTYGVDAAFSPDETAYIAAIRREELPDAVMDELTWNFESFWALMWVLGELPELGSPAHMCDPGAIVARVLGNSRQQLLGDAEVQPVDAILDAADLYYRYHWACVDTMGTQAQLNTGVVYRRRYALDWLVRHGTHESWDDVVLHT
jgi:hypothetical protein